MNHNYVIITTASKGRGLYTLKYYTKDELIIIENPITCISYNIEENHNTNNNNDTINNNNDAIKNINNSIPSYNEFELDLIHKMKDNIQSISLVLLIGRIMKLIYNNNSSSNNNNNNIELYINSLNIPLLSFHSKQINKLQISAKLVLCLLSNINQENRITENQCYDILSRCICNVFTITDIYSNPIGLGLYNIISSINHSCIPNSIPIFKDISLQIITKQCIEKDKEITISYTDTSKSTWCRRYNLMQSYCFFCECERCCQNNILEGFQCQCCITNTTKATNIEITLNIDNNNNNNNNNNNICIPTNESMMIKNRIIEFYYHFNIQDEDILDILTCFEELSLPYGDIFISIMNHNNKNNAVYQYLTNFNNINNNNNNNNNNSEEDVINNNLEIELLLPLFKCKQCDKKLQFYYILYNIKEIYQKWKLYHNHKYIHSNNNHTLINNLCYAIKQIKLLDEIYDILKTFVTINHYSILQILDLLLNYLSIICDIYKELITLTPNNIKIKDDYNKMKLKYNQYSILIKNVMKICSPNY